MSANLIVLASNAFRTYVAASIGEANATVGAEDAFMASAIAHAEAIIGGAEAKALAAANRVIVADLKDEAPAGVLYTSGAAIGYHALTGRVFMLPTPVSKITRRAVQTVVRTATDAIGTKAVKAMIDGATDQASLIVALETATDKARKAKQAAAKADAKARENVANDDADNGAGNGTPVVVPAEDVALTLLAKVAALIEAGHVLSDEARAMIVTLESVTAPALVEA
jgi:hypothetical protein